jgi:hypothetical protein
MTTQLRANTGACSQRQRLLEASENAQAWNEHRAESCRSRLVGKETALLRWQAKYARAHAVWKKHLQNCLLCKLVSQIA